MVKHRGMVQTRRGGGRKQASGRLLDILEANYRNVSENIHLAANL